MLQKRVSSCCCVIRKRIRQRSFTTTTATATTSSGNDNINNIKHQHQQQQQQQQQQNDYWTNDGIIEGVWIFSRHGDRTPSRPLVPNHRQKEEAAYWVTKLPIPTTNTIFTKYKQYYPITIHQPTIQQHLQQQTQQTHTFMDAHRNPYGFITSKGLLQLYNNGSCFYHRYTTHGHVNRNTNTLHNHNNDQTKDQNQNHRPYQLLHDWNIQVYSTNYLRTIMSIQSCLDGLFHTQCYHNILESNHNNSIQTNHDTSTSLSSSSQQEESSTATNTTNTSTDRLYDPNIIKEEPMPSIHGDNDTTNHISDDNNTDDTLVTIQVRDAHHDPLNAFDRNPKLIATLVSEVMNTPEFLQRDGKAASLAARLANILPGLMRNKKTTITKSASNTTNSSSTITSTTGSITNNMKKKDINSNDFSRHAPSRINWVEATDHFVCRTAHDISLSKYTDYETQEEYEQTLQAMSYPTLVHLSWRFRMWYHHERLLAVIAGPPLREIVNSMIQTSQLQPNVEKRPMVFYSCHDITILGLLYAIGADFLAVGGNDSTNTVKNESDDINLDDIGSWRYWPSYGSHLVFELVRIRQNENKNIDTLPSKNIPQSQNQQQHVIRILLDGVPVRSTKITKYPSANASSIHDMFTIHNFEQLVQNLEDAGGFDYDSLLGKK